MSNSLNMNVNAHNNIPDPLYDVQALTMDEVGDVMNHVPFRDRKPKIMERFDGYIEENLVEKGNAAVIETGMDGTRKYLLWDRDFQEVYEINNYEKGIKNGYTPKNMVPVLQTVNTALGSPYEGNTAPVPVEEKNLWDKFCGLFGYKTAHVKKIERTEQLNALKSKAILHEVVKAQHGMDAKNLRPTDEEKIRLALDGAALETYLKEGTVSDAVRQQVADKLKKAVEQKQKEAEEQKNKQIKEKPEKDKSVNKGPQKDEPIKEGDKKDEPVNGGSSEVGIMTRTASDVYKHIVETGVIMSTFALHSLMNDVAFMRKHKVEMIKEMGKTLSEMKGEKLEKLAAMYQNEYKLSGPTPLEKWIAEVDENVHSGEKSMEELSDELLDQIENYKASLKKKPEEEIEFNLDPGKKREKNVSAEKPDFNIDPDKKPQPGPQPEPGKFN